MDRMLPPLCFLIHNPNFALAGNPRVLNFHHVLVLHQNVTILLHKMPEVSGFQLHAVAELVVSQTLAESFLPTCVESVANHGIADFGILVAH